MSDKVSIIVPVYNVEQWLEECLNSITQQTYSNFEALIIDDGSTDNSSKICKMFCQRDIRFKYHHQTNSGLSAARNTGIKLASGQYLYFVDSDDYIPEESINLLRESITKSNSDIAIGTMARQFGEQKISAMTTEGVITKYECIEKMLLRKEMSHSASAKLYKKDLFNGIAFPIGKYYEDQFTIYSVVEKAKLISVINQCVYYYRYREGSILTSQDNYLQKCQDLYDASFSLLRYQNTSKALNLACIYRFAMDNIGIIDLIRKYCTIHDQTQRALLTKSRNALWANLLTLMNYNKMSVRSKLHLLKCLF